MNISRILQVPMFAGVLPGAAPPDRAHDQLDPAPRLHAQHHHRAPQAGRRLGRGHHQVGDAAHQGNQHNSDFKILSFLKR